MSNDSGSNTFFDKNTILALIITFGFFMGWQQYLKIKYPESQKPKAEKQTNKTPTHSKTLQEKAENNNAEDSENEDLMVDTSSDVKTSFISFESPYIQFDISSSGMSLKNIKILKINKVAQKPYKFDYTENLFPTQINGRTVNFSLSQKNETTFVGTALLSNNTKLVKTMSINPESFVIDTHIDVENIEKNQSLEIRHPIIAKIKDPKKAIFFLPAFERNEFYYESSNGSDRRVLETDEKTEGKQKFFQTDLVALSDHYFSMAFLNTGKILPNTTFAQNNENISIGILHNLDSKIASKQADFKLFVGPKRLDLLESGSGRLMNLIDFSFLGFIAKPIVKALNFIYTLVGNYGLAVIVLTFLIRLLILPLAVTSFKSMKKMQKIQPQLKEIKEKYKDQPQKVNQMTMQLMKEQKVNPLGGCLPMLLQLPVFFAFYRGLSESVDLYQAPFALWIQDLSKIDPYFVLPVLSVVGMVVHQLVTPNTMDKAQRRLMLFMPLIFGFFIFTLPSALTLYMVVTTWFGIGQHMIFLRDKPNTSSK